MLELIKMVKNKNRKLSTKIAPSTFKMKIRVQVIDQMDQHSNGKENHYYYVELPIPQDVNDNNTVTWGDDTLNILQLAGLLQQQKNL